MADAEVKTIDQKVEAVKPQGEPAVLAPDPASFPFKVILGRKVGMTRIFSDGGASIPVSVIYTDSCVLTRVKTKASDGYNAIQLGVEVLKEKNLTKPYLGQFKKLNLTPLRWLKEFKVSNPEKFQSGQRVPIAVFSAGDYVDISGVSKGKGFAGVIKRHGFSGLPASHGASDKVNSRGSSGGGSGQPQRVLKGTRMAGRMGSDWVTTQKVEVVKVDSINQIILVKGAVPGTNGGFVVVKETSKNLKHKRAPIISKSAKKAATAKKVTKPAATPAKK